MYRLPDLTMIQSDLLLEFENLIALITPTSRSLKKSSKNSLRYMKVKSPIFQTNVSL